MSDPPPGQRQELISLFHEVTHSNDDSQAQQMLEWYDWQVDRAVNAFMLGNVEAPSSYGQGQGGGAQGGGAGIGSGEGGGPSSGGAGRRPIAPMSVDAPSPRLRVPGTPGQGTGGLAEISRAVDGVGQRVNERANRLSGPARLLLWPIRTAVNVFTGGLNLSFRIVLKVLGIALTPVNHIMGVGDHPKDSAVEARRFISDFETEYGREPRPDFIPEAFREAVAQAHRSHRQLLVYLHSPMHEDTPHFCSKTLCSQQLVDFVSSDHNNLLVWGGSVRHRDAYAAGESLGATKYPFVALLMCRGQGEVHIMDKIEGNLSTEALVQRLLATIDRFRAQSEAVRAQERERAEARRLRSEQDDDYRAALEADRRRGEQEQQERMARERQEREEVDRRNQEQAQAEARKQAREALLHRLRAQSTPEPPPGKDAVRIRLQLPHGAKVDRRFEKTQTVQSVRDFLLLHFMENEIPIHNFSMSTNYPKKTYTEQDGPQTLEQAGLPAQVVLLIHDLDA